ncbi:YfhO family protein [Variovorax sp. GB1P17]|uniref:YfhO family protein n=1 Tax=Variovorax sp. GB1P17 TaxID=3443740 RepID=UPI003F46A7F7
MSSGNLVAMRSNSGRQSSAVVLAALFFLWCIFLWPAFDKAHSFALWMDNEFFIGTVLSSMSSSLAHGEWPLRMNTILGGVPLHNFAQLSAFYPFYLTPLPLFESPIEVVHSMHWLTLVHLLILEINMYVLLRAMQASRVGAVTGAALFAFGANSLSYAAWLNIVAPYAWLPLYLAGLLGLLSLESSRRHFVMALAGIVLLTLASPAQPLIHAILLSAIFCIAHAMGTGRINGWKSIGNSAAKIGIVAVIAVLLVAPVILPTALEFKNMIRWIGNFPPVFGNGRIPFEAFQVDQLAPRDLGGVLFKFKGNAVGSQFIGLVSVALACVAVVSRPRSWMVWALVFIAAYSLISSTGSNLGLAHLNYVVPVLNKIREPSRFLVLFQLAMTVLAAIGIDELRNELSSSEPGRRSLATKLLAMAMTLLVAVLVSLSSKDHIASIVPPWIPLATLAALVLITMLMARSRSGVRGVQAAALWSAAALILVLVDVPWRPPSISTSFYNTSHARQLDEVLDKVKALDPNHDYRVVFDGKIDKQLGAMLASYKGIRSFNAYFNPAPKRQFDELYYHAPRNDNYFRLLGAKYLVCDDCPQESLRGYTHKEDIAGLKLYEADGSLPHVYAATTLDGVYDSLGDFTAKAASTDLTGSVLFMDMDTGVLPRSTSEKDPARCDVKEDLPRGTNHVRVHIACQTPAMLILNEFFDEAWKVSIDGQHSKIGRMNGNQIGTLVPPGSHTVEFKYRPGTFMWSLPLLVSGLALLLVLLIAEQKWLPRLNQRQTMAPRGNTPT